MLTSLYKISKTIIDVEDFHSRSERGVKQELYAHFVLISLSRFLANQVEADLNIFTPMKENDWTTDPFNSTIYVNFKNFITDSAFRELKESESNVTQQLF